MSWQWILIIAGGLFLLVGFHLFSSFYAAHCIYKSTLIRRTKDQWGRNLSIHDPLSTRMDEIGMQWHRQHKDRKRDVHIVNNGLNLYGEYYDFGRDKAVMILSGRTESLRYGYYFAKPYSDNGYNVLVVDSRGHGLSDGQYNTVGFEESKDDLAWVRFLHDSCGMNFILFHGICIGAAGGMLAITSPDCPDYVRGIVTEGMFANFGESMRNHLIERKRNIYPVMQCVDFWMKHYTGHSMMRGPIDVIGTMDKPLLMIQSKKDKYSSPAYAQKLYDLCPSKEKELVYFETGDHSMLRITDTKKYDTAVETFLAKLSVAQAEAIR